MVIGKPFAVTRDLYWPVAIFRDGDFSGRIHKIGGNILAAAACSETSQYFLCDQTENTSKASGPALPDELWHLESTASAVQRLVPLAKPTRDVSPLSDFNLTSWQHLRKVCARKYARVANQSKRKYSDAFKSAQVMGSLGGSTGATVSGHP